MFYSIHLGINCRVVSGFDSVPKLQFDQFMQPTLSIANRMNKETCDNGDSLNSYGNMLKN